MGSAGGAGRRGAEGAEVETGDSNGFYVTQQQQTRILGSGPSNNSATVYKWSRHSALNRERNDG